VNVTQIILKSEAPETYKLVLGASFSERSMKAIIKPAINLWLMRLEIAGFLKL